MQEHQVEAYLNNLNNEQLEAVETTEGPLLVLAGAGTGKTKVLTSRIAHILMQKKAFQGQILAVTFTNKAAKEMKSRIETSMGNVEGLWLGTFHSIASKILRRHAELVGLKRDFTIIDYDDQLRLAKQVIKDQNLDDKKNPPKLLLYLIGKLKDKAYSYDKVPVSENSDYADGRLTTLYREYQNRLKQLNACDFGDLLLYNLELFNKHDEVLIEYQNKFKYILVDEYQDTNVCQYLWLRLLAQKNKNICCVGDDDQSIYGWRGADVTNILKFDRDFVDAKIIRLERNYRSTSHILSAATELISNNKTRHGKELWTDVKGGNRIKLNSFYDEREEARFIADEIESLLQKKEYPAKEIAILIRAGYQTRSFEESLNFLRIPYRIVGGMKFYERLEIKDILAYIRVLNNRGDDLAFERIINTPKRGVGTATLQHMHIYSKHNSIPLIHSIPELLKAEIVKGKVGAALQKLITDFDHWSEMLKVKPHWQVIDTMLVESGYIDMWKEEGTDEAKERLDNIKELINSLEDFNDITEYLEHISLISDVDNIVDDNKINVMTIHAAKGLEFETVFLAGWEEGIFPSQKSIDENGETGVEEERRLAYVGITRAKSNLYISFANNRRIYGSYQPAIPSRFIDELPRSDYEIINNFGRFKSVANEVSSQVVFDDVKENKMRPGARVFHIKFGYGKVLNVANGIVEVSFEKSNIKKVLSEYLSAA